MDYVLDGSAMIIWRITDRGFIRGEFKDRYSNECSIQASSLATEDCIWLGCDHETKDDTGQPCGARMHLTREMAGQLAAQLLSFYSSGHLEPMAYITTSATP